MLATRLPSIQSWPVRMTPPGAWPLPLFTIPSDHFSHSDVRNRVTWDPYLKEDSHRILRRISANLMCLRTSVSDDGDIRHGMLALHRTYIHKKFTCNFALSFRDNKHLIVILVLSLVSIFIENRTKGKGCSAANFCSAITAVLQQKVASVRRP